MKKLLYITVNPKPESLSVSKTVGREFVNRFLEYNPNYELEELDLYQTDIPEVNHRIFTHRARLVSGEEYERLNDHEKYLVNRANILCEQFILADTYVIAAPMWSTSYPSRLKLYLDCIIQNNKVIRITRDKVTGLLDDKDRYMVYIQSSGGVYPKILEGMFNHGVDYMDDTFTFLGIKKFYKLLVQGVDDPEVGKEKAIEIAYEDMESILKKMSRAK